MSTSQNIISANNLRTGLNVYFAQDGDNSAWHTDARKATVFDDAAAADALVLAQQDMAKNIVVDCVIVPLDETHTPLTTREKIRAGGPSVAYGASAEA